MVLGVAAVLLPESSGTPRFPGVSECMFALHGIVYAYWVLRVGLFAMRGRSSNLVSDRCDRMNPTTKCECPAPGWCERHQVDKHLRWWQLCQDCTQITGCDSPGAYFDLWDDPHRAGPGQTMNPELVAHLTELAVAEERPISPSAASISGLQPPPCAHLGGYLRTIDRPGCGCPPTDVSACAIHVECVPRGNVRGGPRPCLTCPDRTHVQ